MNKKNEIFKIKEKYLWDYYTLEDLCEYCIFKVHRINTQLNCFEIEEVDNLWVIIDEIKYIINHDDINCLQNDEQRIAYINDYNTSKQNSNNLSSDINEPDAKEIIQDIYDDEMLTIRNKLYKGTSISYHRKGCRNTHKLSITPVIFKKILRRQWLKKNCNMKYESSNNFGCFFFFLFIFCCSSLC